MVVACAAFGCWWFSGKPTLVCRWQEHKHMIREADQWIEDQDCLIQVEPLPSEVGPLKIPKSR